MRDFGGLWDDFEGVFGLGYFGPGFGLGRFGPLEYIEGGLNNFFGDRLGEGVGRGENGMNLYELEGVLSELLA